jgi:hypothetical protein
MTAATTHDGLLEDLRVLARNLQSEGRDAGSGIALRALDAIKELAADQGPDLTAMTDDEFADVARARGWSVRRDRRCGERYDREQDRSRLAYTNWTYVAESPRKFDDPIEWVS